MIIEKSPEQLVREDLIRQTLEMAARRIESYGCNAVYKRALVIGAKMIRDMYPSILAKD